MKLWAIITIVIIMILFALRCYAIDPFAEMNIPADKVLHFEASYLLCDYMQDGLKWDNWAVFWGITGMSVAKEYIDSQTGGKADMTDIYANYAGWAFRRVFVVKLRF